jgi:predicted ATP-grasp superfamily ATP-dependent carboligase
LKIYKILVLDAAQRSALAVVRSLGQHPELCVITAEATPEALAGTSRYSSQYLKCPSAEHQPNEFVKWLAVQQSEQQFDLVIPVTEITSQLILINKDKLPTIPTPFPAYEQVMQLADKGNLVKLATSLGLQCPQSEYFANSKNFEVEKVEYPCVIKPVQSRLFMKNTWINTSVGIIRSATELQSYLQKNRYLEFSGFMLQEFIPGHGAGIFCLYNQGQPVTFFAHKRLREKPPQGGVSVLSESQPVDDKLKTFAQTLLNAAQWHGVAMVEFRIDQNGTAYLMEINTRFWGSLQLSIDSGVDFPWLLVARQLGLPHDIPNHYTLGRRLRWWLGDLDSLYIYLKSKATVSSKLKRLGWFLLPNIHTRHEINRLSDFNPAVYEFKRYLSSLRGAE